MAEHVFTLDLGTSGPKVATFTVDGTFVDGDFSPVPLHLFPDGGAEQSPADWWRAVVESTHRLLGRHAVPVESFVAVAVTAQWSGTVPIDRSGAVLHDAIIWMDSRGAAAIREAVGGRVRLQGFDPRKLKRWVSRTGGAPSRSGKDPTAHILWLQRERPDVARATWKYLEPKDWLNHRLTGVAAATFDSITLHWVTDNRDPGRVEYDPTLLDYIGIVRDQLPDLQPSTSVVGELRRDVAEELGLPPGIPVVGGTPDVQSAAIGSGAVHDFAAHLYIGTSSWLTCHVPFKKTDVRRGIATLPSPLPGKYYVADEQEAAGACVNWLRDNVLYPDDSLRETPVPLDVYSRLDDLASSLPPGSGGVIFTPWLNGERTPVDDYRLRGGWHNLSLRSTRAEMVRAVLEGVAYNTRWLLGTVEKFVDRRFPGLAFVGGGAQSDLWCQVIADVLDRPIHQVAEPVHANTRGAALLAGLSLKRLTIDDVARAVRITRAYAPDQANRSTYDELYREFRALHKQTKGIYARLNT
ncbi:MAG: xylulokinase [Actinomycetota bacterium]